MSHTRKLLGPIISAAVGTVALTCFAIVVLVRRESEQLSGLFDAVWPLVTASSVAVILVMSLLHRTLQDVVKELEAREASAQYAALHDPLTGLPNRALLEDRLIHTLSYCRREGERTGVLMLDLDKFKAVNDTYGHSAGDELLQQAAQRLKSLLRESDTVARLGGDEFVVIQLAPRSAADVRRLCERITRSLQKPFLVHDRKVEVGVSIGALYVAASAEQASELLRRADQLMYAAKAAGRGCCRLSSVGTAAENRKAA